MREPPDTAFEDPLVTRVRQRAELDEMTAAMRRTDRIGCYLLLGSTACMVLIAVVFYLLVLK
jgi:hypothetical protein